MRKYFYLLFILCTVLFSATSCNQSHQNEMEDEENEGYDGIASAQQFEFERTKDPALNRVPTERLWAALDYTKALKANYAARGVSLLWTERGPNYDSVGSSNGNGRGGGGGSTTGGSTSGRITGFVVDKADATGNTVFCAGVAGGLWKCTNFLSSTPNWSSVNDYFSNMNISSVCQDPSNTNIMYFATGEPYAGGFDAVKGNGIWKSVDHGQTWNLLVSSTSYTRAFKILCDASGNVYCATYGSGLVRSLDGGISWLSIGVTGATNCSDIEISSTGKLHASFGYGSGVSYRYTTTPAAVSAFTWTSATSLTFASTPRRFELATSGDVVYGITTSSSDNINYCYKSVDGGANWTKQNSSAYTAFTSSQGWYDITLSVNPSDPSEIMMGQLDAYRSTDNGATVSRTSYWVGFGAYVHADHHLMEWTNVGGESRIIIASDGGLFYSNDGGFSYVDKNRNLSLKQFYSCALHPTQTNYIFGGAQDNGCHLLKNTGLSYSFEVIGGDGGYTHIDQNNPQYYIGSYVYKTFRVSSNGGTSFNSFDFSTSQGLFINPWAYDDQQKIIYACGGSGVVFRWNNPTSASSVASSITTNLNISAGTPTAFAVSPYTANTVYVGTSSGNIARLDNANTGSTANETILASPGGYISSISVGTSDNYLVATSSSYGVDQVNYSTNGGATWTAIDGNLPDMPVRWAVFHPTDNTKILIATEAGVYTTVSINGASTQWFPSPGFPLVRTDMLQVRASDNTVVAATHGRGMYTANILSVLPLRNVTLRGGIENENTSSLSWTAYGATNRTHYHLQYSTDGGRFTEIADLGSSVSNYKHLLTSAIGYYRIMAVEPNEAPVFSNTIVVKSGRAGKTLQASINPNPVSSTANITISSPQTGDYSWQISDVMGRVLQSGKGNLTSTMITYPLEVNKLIAGTYFMQIRQGNSKTTTAFIKQ